MNTRHAVAICLILLLELFAIVAYRSRLLPAAPTSAVTREPEPVETGRFNASQDLRAEMLQRVRGEGVRSVETVSVSHGRCVFVGTLDAYWDLKHIKHPTRLKTDIWLVDRDGGLRRLTTDGMSYNPEWSPSGSEIRTIDLRGVSGLTRRGR